VRCIYCLEDKDVRAFTGREHVVPQAFGVFTNNLVLKCVCDDCNHYLGRELDLKLARDSPEAFDRITVGLKSATEFESLGRRSTSHVEFQEEPLAGGKGYAIASRDGGETLGVLAFPQVWFAQSTAGPYERFRADEVPTKEELVARGYEPGTPLFIRTFEIEDPTAFLASKGFKLDGEPQRLDDQPEGHVRIENVLRIAEPEFRAATKIALNYLAAVVGSEIALDPLFDNARHFARHGKARTRLRVYPFENRRFLGRKGHYISLSRVEDMVVAQLSLLMRTQYVVVLADGASDVTLPSTAHLFDLEDGRLKEIEPLPIVPGRPLKPLP
jgi:hypothetical protein